MAGKNIRNIVISVFVVVWTLVFHYESTRTYYLEPMLHRNLPKIKFLFPPAGWIMFYNVDASYACAEIYGLKGNAPQILDPHDILETRTIGFDNIHRNVLSTLLDPGLKPLVCRFLQRKFPYFDGFAVTAVYWPEMLTNPQKKLYRVMYQCP